MQLGKLTFATDFAPRDIDSDVPAFHRELLCAWINYKCYHERIDIPDSLLDIFEEPLFINVNNKPLFYRDLVSYGLVRVKDICYEAAPGFLPVRALHEILIDHESCKDRTFNQTARELSKVLEGIPAKWKLKVINGDSVSSSPAQPSFSFLPSAPDKPPTSTLDCKTRHFYRQFHKSEQISSPKLDYWRSFSLWHLLTRRYGTRCTHHWSLTLEGFPVSVTYGLAAELNGCLCIGKLSSLWRHRNDRA